MYYIMYNAYLHTYLHLDELAFVWVVVRIRKGGIDKEVEKDWAPINVPMRDARTAHTFS